MSFRGEILTNMKKNGFYAVLFIISFFVISERDEEKRAEYFKHTI